MNINEIDSNYYFKRLELIADLPSVESVASPSPAAGRRRFKKETSLQAIQFMAQQQESPYNQLICTPKDKKLIADLTKLLAKHNRIWFFFHQGEMKEKIKPIKNRVHVLKILETVFTDPKLKKSIREIYDDKSKWEMVVEEMNKKMKKAEKNGSLEIYRNDFAAAIGVRPEEIKDFFLKKNWEGLLRFLVKKFK